MIKIFCCKLIIVLMALAWIGWKRSGKQRGERVLKRLGSLDDFLVYSTGLDADVVFDQVTRKLGSDRVPIFAYGSLLCAESARVSLSESTVKTRVMAWAYGVRRVFNRDVGRLRTEHKWIAWSERLHPHARASLNLKITGKAADTSNGMIYWVDREDFRQICQREDAYDLVPVWVRMRGDDGKLEQEWVAYTFSVRDAEYLSKEVTPRIQYYAVCRKAAGAMEASGAFLFEWLKTTYLADEETTVEEWDRQQGYDLSSFLS